MWSKRVVKKRSQKEWLKNVVKNVIFVKSKDHLEFVRFCGSRGWGGEVGGRAFKTLRN